MNRFSKQHLVPGALVVVWLALWIISYFMSIADVFETRWNYRRHGPFQASAPSMSPDGTLIAFDSARTGNGDIYLAGTTGSNVQCLVSSLTTESDPVFTWDGEAIVFARQTSGYQHIWMYHLREKSETQLTTGRVIDVPVSSSTNGIIFRRSTFYGMLLMARTELFETGLAGSEKAALRRFGAVECVSPDGASIVREQADARSREEELWIDNRGNKTSQRIGSGWAPSFSRDGRRIVYLERSPDYSDRILMVNLDGTDKLEVYPLSPCMMAPKFCLQDNAVIFRTSASERYGPGGIHIYRLSQRSRTEILNGW